MRPPIEGVVYIVKVRQYLMAFLSYGGHEAIRSVYHLKNLTVLPNH